jgi:histidinol dehydrogenase
MKICKKGLHEYTPGQSCPGCRKIKDKNWRIANAAKFSEKEKLYREVNKQRRFDINKKYREENKEALIEYNKKFKAENRDKINANEAKYRASKLNATPKWLTKEHLNQIKSLYKEAKELEKLNNIKYHVDHIVPLQGENVSGLHVPWNLRVITADENFSKNNRLTL